jgi:hypothetical protein
MDKTQEQLVEEAKDRLADMEDLGESHPGIHEYMLNMEACYQAMLDVQDHSWRVRHQGELSIARDTLADILGLNSQTVQEHYEDLAAARLKMKQEVCW